MASASDDFVVVMNKKNARKARHNEALNQVGYFPSLHLFINIQIFVAGIIVNK